MPDDIAAADEHPAACVGTRSRHSVDRDWRARSAPYSWDLGERSRSIHIMVVWDHIGFLCFCVARDGRAAADRTWLQVVR